MDEIGRLVTDAQSLITKVLVTAFPKQRRQAEPGRDTFKLGSLVTRENARNRPISSIYYAYPA